MAAGAAAPAMSADLQEEAGLTSAAHTSTGDASSDNAAALAAALAASAGPPPGSRSGSRPPTTPGFAATGNSSRPPTQNGFEPGAASRGPRVSIGAASASGADGSLPPSAFAMPVSRSILGGAARVGWEDVRVGGPANRGLQTQGSGMTTRRSGAVSISGAVEVLGPGGAGAAKSPGSMAARSASGRRALKQALPVGPAGGTRVSAVGNIGDALSRYYAESLMLAPKASDPGPPSSSSDEEFHGTLSSDDELTKEEMDVLERLYLTMPDLESPGKGRVQRPATSARTSSASRPASAKPGGNPTPRTPAQASASPTPQATARNPSPGVVPPGAGSPDASPKRPSGLVGRMRPVTAPAPTSASLAFHSRPLGVTVPLPRPSGMGAGGAAAGRPAGSSHQQQLQAGLTAPVAPGDALSSLYVDRDADVVMMQQLVSTMVSQQAKRAAAGQAGAHSRGVRGGAAIRSAPPASRRAGAGKAGAAPIQLPPAHTIPSYLQHLVRPGSSSAAGIGSRKTSLELQQLIANAAAAQAAAAAAAAATPRRPPPSEPPGGARARSPGPRSPSPAPAAASRPATAATVSNPSPPTSPGAGGRPSSSGDKASRPPSSRRSTADGGGAGHGGAPARPQSAAMRAMASSSSLHSTFRPHTVISAWTQTQLSRIKGIEETKAVARAAMSPLRASLASPISGLRANRMPRPLDDEETEVLNKSIDSALHPITKAAARLGTYGERFPGELLAALMPGGAAPNKQPPPLQSPSKPGLVPLGADSSASESEPGPLSGSPRRKMRYQDNGDWEWPPGCGNRQQYSVLVHTQDELAVAMRQSEEEQAGHSGACDRVGELGRLLRRYLTHGLPASFNLSHAVNGIDQVVALVDALAHPALASISELLMASNQLVDATFLPLAARLASPECAGLTSLDLAGNTLTAGSVESLLPLLQDDLMLLSRAARAKRLEAGVVRRACLTRLVLDGNALGDAGAELLCDAVAADNCRLAELRICRCGIGERGAVAIGRMLEYSRSLLVLDISWNSLGRRGGKSVGEGLRQSSAIQELYVARSGVTDIGASHIARALSANISLKLLDLSGCGVSGDTSLVLLDAISGNQALETLLLRDNPLGVAAARKLLKAVDQGIISKVDMLGCSFGMLGGSATAFDPTDPDGVYELNLETPAHYQVAIELVGLAAQMGLRSWRSASLEGQTFRLLGASKLQIPQRGRLKVEFVSCTPLPRDGRPLTDDGVRSMWFSLVDPDGKRTPQGPMSHAPVGRGAVPGLALGLGSAQASGNSSVVASPRSARSGAASPSSARSLAANRQASMKPQPASSRLANDSRDAAGSSPDTSPAAGAQAASGAAATPRAPPRGAATPANGTAGASSRHAHGKGSGSGKGGAGLPSHTELKGATDDWKLNLLCALVTDVRLTCGQLKHMIQCFESRTVRAEAVVQAFGVLADTENFYDVLEALEADQRAQVESRLGKARLFSPENPTGRYTLILSQLPHQCVGKQLLEQFNAQWDAKLCEWPHHVCFTHCIMDGASTDVSDPHKLYLPMEGMLELCFVDLRPVAPATPPLSRAQFAVLLGSLVNLPKLDPVMLVRAIQHPALRTAVAALRRWSAWSDRHPLSACIATLRLRHAAQLKAQQELTAQLALSRASTLAGGVDSEDSGNSVGSGLSGLSTAPPGALTRSLSPLRQSLARGALRPAAAAPGSHAHDKVTWQLGTAEALQPGAAAEQPPGGGHAPVTPLGLPPSSQPASAPNSARPKTAVPQADPYLGPFVQDMSRYVEAIRMLSVHHYVTCWQLLQLLRLLPDGATDERVETVTAFWARTVDRKAHWVDVMRSLTNEQQVRACQRLGYMNVFDLKRPAMHYRLRMFKPDEHEVAWQLYNLSLDSSQKCWINLTIDDVPKRVNQGFNMWTVLRGNAADGTTPTTQLEFDFVWPDEDAPQHLAAEVIQRAWRRYKRGDEQPGGAVTGRGQREALEGDGGMGAPRFAQFSKKKKKGAPASKMNDPSAGKRSRGNTFSKPLPPR